MFTFGSLFSGIGGMDLGLERAGMVCKWQVEINEYATRVLQKHWPAIPRFRDVRDCGSHNLASVDLIAGGFPCQDVSAANPHGAGLNGKRSGLWAEMFRIICELRPRYVVVENVSNLLNRGISRVLGDLAACGYDAEWQCLPASAFSAPHERERLFIVAYTPSERCGFLPLLTAELHTKNAPQLWESFRAVDHKVWLKTFCGLSGDDNGFSLPMDDDRFRVIGNAVVPQIAEWIGAQILLSASPNASKQMPLADAQTLI